MNEGEDQCQEERCYNVALIYEAVQAYRAISSQADLASVNGMLDVLDTAPYIGRIYDPLYEAATPPFEVRVVYAGHYGIYYTLDEKAQQVNVYFIEDQRQNPLNRFDDSVR